MFIARADFLRTKDTFIQIGFLSVQGLSISWYLKKLWHYIIGWRDEWRMKTGLNNVKLSLELIHKTQLVQTQAEDVSSC